MPNNVIAYVNNLKKNTNLTDLQEAVIKNYQLSKSSKPIQVLYIPDILQQFPWEIFEHYNWKSMKECERTPEFIRVMNHIFFFNYYKF